MTDTDTKPKPSLGWTRILLFASLAVNLLVVGVVAGALVRHERPGDDMADTPMLREFGLGPYGVALSPDDRREMGRQMREKSGDLRKTRTELRAHFEDFLTALRAVPFDPEAVEQIILQQQIGLEERQEMGQTLLLGRIGAMSDVERSRFADRLEKTLRRYRRN